MIEIPAYKDELRNTWYASFYYTDWQGKRRLKKKRGFQRKKDAQAFEEEFLRTRARSCDMTFRSFAEIYLGDMEPRLKLAPPYIHICICTTDGSRDNRGI
mgnify:CR=1 FL=1